VIYICFLHFYYTARLNTSLKSITTNRYGTQDLPVKCSLPPASDTPTNCFSTGATGYVGGDTLFALYDKHSDYEIAALVRTGTAPSCPSRRNLTLTIVPRGESQTSQESIP
jgi:hypothetical protein